MSQKLLLLLVTLTLFLALGIAAAPEDVPIPCGVGAADCAEGEYMLVVSGGSFRRLRDAFRPHKGVMRVQLGYTGGFRRHPTYKEVCDGVTGHAEAVQVVYTNATTFRELLRTFFAAHDPSLRDMEAAGGALGTQYRSNVFWRSEAQRAAAQDVIQHVGSTISAANSTKYITTELVRFDGGFYAEEASDEALHQIQTASFSRVAERMASGKSVRPDAVATSTPLSGATSVEAADFPADSPVAEKMKQFVKTDAGSEALTSESPAPATERAVTEDEAKAGLLEYKPTNPKGILIAPRHHTIDGINMYRSRFLNAFMCAIDSGRDFVVRPVFAHAHFYRGESEKLENTTQIPLEDIFDFRALSEAMHDLTNGTQRLRRLEDLGLSQKLKDFESFKSLGEEWLWNHGCFETEQFHEYTKHRPVMRSIDTEGSGHALQYAKNVARYARLSRAFRPAAHIAAYVAEAIRSLKEKTNNASGAVLCLHLRSEGDFKKLMVDIMKYSSVFYNATATARKVLYALKTAYLGAPLRDVKAMVVAGDHAKDSEELRILRDNLFNGAVFTKNDLIRTMPDLAHAQKTVLDEGICVGADVFVGNFFSTWSEWLYELRNYNVRTKSPGALHSNGQRNFMVNDHQRQTGLWALQPFCFFRNSKKDVPPLGIGCVNNAVTPWYVYSEQSLCRGACVASVCGKPDGTVVGDLEIVVHAPDTIMGFNTDPEAATYWSKGAGMYGPDSHLGAAAVHAGALKPGQTGTVVVTCTRVAEPATFTQVATGSATPPVGGKTMVGQYGFTLKAYDHARTATPIVACDTASCVEDRCVAEGQRLHVRLNDSVPLGAVDANGTTVSSDLFGGPLYTRDSNIRAAAVQMGLAASPSTAGTVVTVHCLGKAHWITFWSWTKNGVQSRDSSESPNAIALCPYDPNSSDGVCDALALGDLQQP